MFERNMINGLQYIISLSNDTPIEANIENLEEQQAVTLVDYLSQMIDIESDEFVKAINDLGIDQYCEAEVLQMAYQTQNFDRATDIELLDELTTKEITGEVFNRTITEICASAILRNGLLSEYRGYINSALELIKNSKVQAARLFA